MSKNLLKWEDFKFIKENELASNLYNESIEKLLKTDFFTIEEKEYINKTPLIFHFTLNEGFLTSFKTKLKNAADDLGQGIVNKLEKISDSAQKIARSMVDAIKDIWDEAIKFFKGQFDKHKNTIVKKFSDKDKTWYGELSDEMKNLKELLGFWLNAFISKLSAGVASSFSKEIQESIDFSNLDEVMNLIESADSHEGSGSISKIVHSLASKPPFSWLHALQHKYKVAIGTGLNKFAEITKDFGGPSIDTKFEGVSEISASYAELKTKDLIKGFVVKPLFKFLLGPIGATIVSIVGFIAMCITVYETCEVLIKLGNGNSEDGHGEEDSNH